MIVQQMCCRLLLALYQSGENAVLLPVALIAAAYVLHDV